jgi:tetratricopeptide (TPR) repeat protein
MERYHRFLAVQHYVSNQTEQLRQALDRIDVKGTDDRELLLKSKFLPQILQANLFLYEGAYEDAVKIYRTVIARADNAYREIQSQRFRLREHRRLEFLSIVCALLYNNLANVLAKTDAESPLVIDAFQKSIELQPNLLMLRENLGWYFVDRARWREAETAFVDAYACCPTRENDERHHANLAQLRHLQAMELKGQGESAGAISVLESGMEELAEKELHAWEGKLRFDLGEVYRDLPGKVDAALGAYEQSAKLYVQAKDNASASYIIEVLAGFLAERGETEEALKKFHESLQYALEPQQSQSTDRTKEPRLLAKMGILNLWLDRHNEAAVLLDKSWNLWRREDGYEPYGKMVADIHDLLQLEEARLHLKLYLQRRLRLVADSKQRRDIVGALRRCWSGAEKHLEPQDGLPESPANVAMLPVVTPIALEIDDKTLGDIGGEHQFIDSLAPNMRDRLYERYGVKVPGIRLRANEADMPYGLYVLMINEVPLKVGSVRPGKVLFLGTPEELERLGVDNHEAGPEFYGETALWIERKKVKKLSAASDRLLSVAEVPMRDLEEFVTANLVEFVGHQEVEGLLESHGLMGPGSGDIVTLGSHDHMDPLTNVVRTLLRERVPMNDFPRIHAIFLRHWDQRHPPRLICEAIRRDPKIRPALWGNDASFAHLKLGESFMTAIERGIRGVDETVLALEPEIIQELLASVREAVQGHRKPALIVPRQNRRSVIRGLLEIEFPQIPILAMAELEPGLGNRIRDTIDPDPAFLEWTS